MARDILYLCLMNSDVPTTQYVLKWVTAKTFTIIYLWLHRYLPHTINLLYILAKCRPSANFFSPFQCPRQVGVFTPDTVHSLYKIKKMSKRDIYYFVSDRESWNFVSDRESWNFVSDRESILCHSVKLAMVL